MKYFSAFSGVEGFGQGFPKEWECVGFSETDKYCSMVLKYHYPNVKNYGDITKIIWAEVPDFDVLVGGSPCQDFSIAGKRRGLQGSRSSLAWEFIRGLRSKKPGYFIWENVRGVMSSRGGWDFANLLCAFSESGYDLWWQVLNAKDFGVPQNRERIFIFGFREGSPKEVFFEPKDSEQIEIVGSTKGDENTRIGERDSVYADTGIMGGLKATDYKQPPQILVEKYGKHQQDMIYDPKGIAPAIPAGTHGSTPHLLKILVVGNKNPSSSGMSSQKHPFIKVKELSPYQGDHITQVDEVHPTLSSQGGNQMRGIGLQDKKGAIRKLMPIECERLMSWQDDWTKYGTDEKGNRVEISDSQRYKMCGNGVVSNVVRELAKIMIV